MGSIIWFIIGCLQTWDKEILRQHFEEKNKTPFFYVKKKPPKKTWKRCCSDQIRSLFEFVLKFINAKSFEVSTKDLSLEKSSPPFQNLKSFFFSTSSHPIIGVEFTIFSFDLLKLSNCMIHCIELRIREFSDSSAKSQGWILIKFSCERRNERKVLGWWDQDRSFYPPLSKDKTDYSFIGWVKLPICREKPAWTTFDSPR